MIDAVTCNDCQEVWKNICPYCKDKSLEFYKAIVVKKDISVKKDVFKSHNVFSNKFKILGKKGKCIYCEGFANTIDHFYPRSKGGVLTVHCCFDCNQQKADLTPIQWIMYIDHVYNGSEEKKELMKKNTNKLISRTLK
jgi:hypothetical protein